MSAPPNKPMAAAVQATATFSPTVQIGPDFNGVVSGYYYSGTVAFYVELGRILIKDSVLFGNVI